MDTFEKEKLQNLAWKNKVLFQRVDFFSSFLLPWQFALFNQMSSLPGPWSWRLEPSSARAATFSTSDGGFSQANAII
jgi:hypothetical protein